MTTKRPIPVERGHKPMSRNTIIAALVFVRLVILIVAIIDVHTRTIADPSILRFRQIATSPGRMWRDFPVEFPPIEALTIRFIGGGNIAAAATRVAVLSFGSDLGVAWLLWRSWGPSATTRYLVLGLPLLVFVYLRLDLFSVFLTVGALALVKAGRPRAGGACFAAAVLFRIWPLVIAPALLAKGSNRAAKWAVGTCVGGVLLWITWGGAGAVTQVVTYRGAMGWELGSTAGAVIWILSGGPIRMESGAFRVGQSLGWTRAPLFGALLGMLAAVWVKASRRGDDRLGLPSLAAVAALLFCSPVLSDAYVAWLLPWAAIGITDGRSKYFNVVLTIAGLTAVPEILAGHLTDPMFQAVTITRDLLIGGLVAMWLLERAPLSASGHEATFRVGPSK
jgi:hypothetical protein